MTSFTPATVATLTSDDGVLLLSARTMSNGNFIVCGPYGDNILRSMDRILTLFHHARRDGDVLWTA
jgi:hypothetical protein